MTKCIQHLADLLDLNEEQTVLIVSWIMSFLLQALVLYTMHNDKFDAKWFAICLVLNIMYNISYFKLFL